MKKEKVVLFQLLWRGIVYLILMGLAFWTHTIWILILLLFFATFDMAWWAEHEVISHEKQSDTSHKSDKTE